MALNSQTITTSRPGAREQALTAIASNTPCVWLFDNGYAAICPNGVSDPIKGVLTGVNIFSRSDAQRGIQNIVSQWGSCVTIIGNAGFAAVYGNGAYVSNDIGDGQAQAAAVSKALANSGINSVAVQ